MEGIEMYSHDQCCRFSEKSADFVDFWQIRVGNTVLS